MLDPTHVRYRLIFINLIIGIYDLVKRLIVEMIMSERSDVRSQISRRTVILQSVGGAAGAAALVFAKPRAAAAKMAPAGAAYQDAPKGDQQCSNCSLFQAPSACQLVDGTISPSGWCKYWVKKAG